MSLECPYCEKEIAEVDDCNDPCMTYEHICHHCEKTFIFEVEYTKHYSASKADCLNGGEHDYKNTNSIPSSSSRMRCSMCGDEQPIAAPMGA